MEDNGNTTNFFDMSQDNQEVKEIQDFKQEEIKDEESKTTIFDMSKEEDASQKETDDKNADDSKDEEKGKKDESSKDSDDKSDKKDVKENSEKKTFKIKSSSEKLKNDDKPNEENKEKETAPLTESSVLAFLKDHLQLDISDIKELSKKEILPDSVKEFKKFVEETGRGHKAYFNAKRDWSKESQDTTIKEFYKYKNPNLSDKDINTQLDLLKLTEDEKEELTDREIRSRELEYNRTYSEALAYMQGVADKFNQPLEEVQQKVTQPTPEQIAEAHKPYWNKRDASLDKLNEIVLPIEDLGDIKIDVPQNIKDMISKRTQTQGDFFADWMGEDKTIDTDKTVEDMAWTIKESREYLLGEFLSQAYTMFMENFSKENRNVTLDKPKDIKPETDNSISVQKYSDKEPSSFGGNQMGEPILK